MFGNKQRKTDKFILSMSAKTLLRMGAALLCGFFMGKVNISTTIYPFGISFMVATFMLPHILNPYMAAGGVLLAMASSAHVMDNPAYNFAVFAVCCALLIIATALKLEFSFPLIVALIAVSYITSTLGFRLSYMMGVLSSVVEMVISILMTMVLSKVMQLFVVRGRRRILTDEELVSVCFSGLICVMGLGKIGLFGVYLREAVASYVVVMAGFAGGASLGTAAGVTTALACVIAGTSPVYVGILGITGMAAGACKNYGKWSTAIGSVVSLLFAALYVCYGNVSGGSVLAFFVGVIGFVATPKKVHHKVAQFLNANVLRTFELKLKEERFKELTMGRLKDIAGVFASAGRVFTDSAVRGEEREITYTLAGIPEAACGGCVFYNDCWEESFAGTYSLMQNLYQLYTENGTITKEDLGRFQKKCIHTDKLLAAALGVFKEYEAGYKLESKIAQSRGMIGDQMQGMARVIESLLGEVQTDITFRPEYENKIRIMADEMGLDVRDSAVSISGGTLQAGVTFRTGKPENAEPKLLKAVSKACEMDVKRIAPVQQVGKRTYTVQYAQTHAFDIETGVALVTKAGSEVSGDAHSTEALRDGRHMMLLCDGMGSGKRAARESHTAVSLMEDFYRADFDDKTVLDAINKLLILSSNDEIFSTMDFVMLDLIEGMAKFTKIGAPHSYVITKDGMRKLQAGSLPIGILEDYEPIVYEVPLSIGDTIVLFTDGIADLEEENDELYEIIRSAAKLRNAKESADYILAHALAMCDGVAPDDMTVMVGRIVK